MAGKGHPVLRVDPREVGLEPRRGVRTLERQRRQDHVRRGAEAQGQAGHQLRRHRRCGRGRHARLPVPELRAPVAGVQEGGRAQRRDARLGGPPVRARARPRPRVRPHHRPVRADVPGLQLRGLRNLATRQARLLQLPVDRQEAAAPVHPDVRRQAEAPRQGVPDRSTPGRAAQRDVHRREHAEQAGQGHVAPTGDRPRRDEGLRHRLEGHLLLRHAGLLGATRRRGPEGRVLDGSGVRPGHLVLPGADREPVRRNAPADGHRAGPLRARAGGAGRRRPDLATAERWLALHMDTPAGRDGPGRDEEHRPARPVRPRASTSSTRTIWRR